MDSLVQTPTEEPRPRAAACAEGRVGLTSGFKRNREDRHVLITQNEICDTDPHRQGVKAKASGRDRLSKHGAGRTAPG